MGMIMNVLLTALCAVLTSAATLRGRQTDACRCTPSDPCWPSIEAWADLNNTIDGRLLAPVPLASVCHGADVDNATCSTLRSGWIFSQTHQEHPTSFVAPYQQNASCNPFTPTAKACELGNYPNYAIRVESADDVIEGLRFARENNIRIVIKNTGHDLLGKSSGAGALSFWTHNLKSIDIFDYSASAYAGKAAKLGAGVQAFEAYEAADAQGLILIGGWCPTVGLSGGYSSGGGHGPVSSIVGLSADSVLEWEVITADGRHLIATPEENSDLYWALTGGGPGTFAIILSMTTKAHPDRPMGGMALNWYSANTTVDAFWGGVATFHKNLPAVVDQGGELSYSLSNATLNVRAGTFPDKSPEQIRAIMRPTLEYLDERKIPYQFNLTSHRGLLPLYKHFSPDFPYGRIPVANLNGGRLIPRATVENDNDAFTQASREIVSDPRFTFISSALNVAHSVSGTSSEDNSINPAWRQALLWFQVLGQWNFSQPSSANQQTQDKLTNEVMPMLINLTPGSGTYLNEANFGEPGWQESFYGANYARLASIKRQYDPEDIFYARTAVGSERWSESNDGRLCRVS